MSNATITTTARHELAITSPDGKDVIIRCVDIYEVSQRDGTFDGYAVGAVSSIGANGKFKLSAFARVLAVLKVDAIHAANWNKYTRVTKDPVKVARLCAELSERFDISVGENAAAIIAANAATAGEVKKATKAPPKTAEEIIAAAYEKAAKGEKGRAGALVATVAAINPADVPAEIAATIAAALRDLAGKIEARATATDKTAAETADNEHGESAPTTCNGVRIVGYVMPGLKGNRRHGVELEDGTVIYDGTPEWAAAIWA